MSSASILDVYRPVSWRGSLDIHSDVSCHCKRLIEGDAARQFYMCISVLVDDHRSKFIVFHVETIGPDNRIFVATKEPEKCIPFVSTYTNCNDENLCDGCQKCTCTAESKWNCEVVQNCDGEADDEPPIQEADMSNLLEKMVEDMKEQKKKEKLNTNTPFVPQPGEDDALLGYENKIYPIDLDARVNEGHRDEYLAFIARSKRSPSEKEVEHDKDNGTVIFHHTVDELNEDTLSNTNISGTLPAHKVVANSQFSPSPNISASSLQIKYKPIINQHAADNKVDTPALHDDQVDLLVHHKIFENIGNYNQTARDKGLSKIVVNELRNGTEIIGDKQSPAISNITFRSDNDTLTAMAFIAGNLLNKLWNMEKDANENSLETETIKHGKINDLLKIFKEPLNIRQETFLKGALDQLSVAIENKDVENIKLCEKIKELKKSTIYRSEAKPKVTEDKKNSDKKYTDVDQSKLDCTAKALKKISNVLELIQKYEVIQNKLSDFKTRIGTENSKTNPKVSAKDLTKDDNETLNVFGNILESLTKLLMPNTKGKKLVEKIKDRNLLTNDKNFSERINFFNLFNLTDLTPTVKDRIVLDYLNHIQNNPDCLFNKQHFKSFKPDLNGDLLLNLSEFFKIKSMSDLLKLVDPNKSAMIPEPEKRTNIDTPISTDRFETTEPNTRGPKNENINRYNVVKEKLKGHIKSLIEDLKDLKNMSGKATKIGTMEISRALPCIYNLLNDGTDLTPSEIKTQQKGKFNKTTAGTINKVTDILNNLQNELKHSQTRRTNIPNMPRPKSAIVWERMIKNVGKKPASRRLMDSEKPKSLEAVKKIIEKLDSSHSNTYKGIAYITDVPMEEKLLLLKTLATDTKKYISTIKDIQQSLETVRSLTVDEVESIEEFMDNVIININLNDRIVKKIEESTKSKSEHSSNQERRLKEELRTTGQVKTFKDSTKHDEDLRGNSFKLTRDQIINQLIRNRMQYYLRLKEQSGTSNRNINVALAKKIIFYLDVGNNSLARELYKILIAQKNIKTTKQIQDPLKYGPANKYKADRGLANKEPLIKFEIPKPINKEISWANQDELIKQLINIQNIKVK